MTLVAGVVFDGQVLLAGDRSAFCPEEMSTDVIHQKKVFIRPPFVIGGAESFRMIQLLEHVFVPPPLERPYDPIGYMVGDFIPALREMMTDNGFPESSSEEAGPPGPMLVGVLGHLYLIQGDYAVLESTTPYDAIGSGKTAFFGAMGALDVAVPDVEPGLKVGIAMDVVAKTTFSVKEPFDLVITP